MTNPAPPTPARHRPALRQTLRQVLRQILQTLALCAIALLAANAWHTRHLPAGQAPALAGPLIGALPANLPEPLPASASAASAAQPPTLTLAQWRAAHPGRPVALHFWADWCGICRLEQPAISALMADTPVLTIATRSGPPPALAQTLAKRQLNWPAIVDERGDIARAWGIASLPTFIVIDPQGRISSASSGYTPALMMKLRLWWAS